MVSDVPRDDEAEREWEREWMMRTGAMSPAFWGAVIEMQLRRVEAGANAHRRREPHPDRASTFDGFGASFTHQFGPIQADAYFFIAAVRHLMVLADRVAERYQSSEARQALDRFEAEIPDAKNVRDVLTHIDEYAMRQGRRKEFVADGIFWIQLGLDFERGEFDLRAGNLRVGLRKTAAAAAELARTLNEIVSRSPPPR